MQAKMDHGNVPFAPLPVTLRRAEINLSSLFREFNEILSLPLQDAMENACLSQTSHHFNPNVHIFGPSHI
jgi:hypothetical protein